MPHQVRGADSGRSAAAVLAVHQALPAALDSFFYGIAALLEIAVQVLSRVVEHGHAHASGLLEAGEGLLPGDIDAEGDPLSREQLRVAGRPGVADEQRGGHFAHCSAAGQGRGVPGTSSALPASSQQHGRLLERLQPAALAVLYLVPLQAQGEGRRRVLVPAALRERRSYRAKTGVRWSSEQLDVCGPYSCSSSLQRVDPHRHHTSSEHPNCWVRQHRSCTSAQVWLWGCGGVISWWRCTLPVSGSVASWCRGRASMHSRAPVGTGGARVDLSLCPRTERCLAL